MAKKASSRRLPVGAEIQPEGGVHFRVWAPRRKKVVVAVHPANDSGRAQHAAMQRESEGYYSAFVPEAASGWRYFFLLDDDDYAYPDPASRFQPEGVHAASEVIDPGGYAWRDDGWNGVSLAGQIIYELHIGTFTQEGTYAAAIEKLPHLADLGVTLVEVMPLAEFPGEFGWGYDGVAWFAPTRLYGRPDDFRRFVDEAHRHGLGVILDVVYNHFGPSGNYTGAFSNNYLSHKRGTEWGDAINFDDDGAEHVRDFVASNAAYWIGEFHLDGLRLDAVHAIVDESPEHVLAQMQRRAREAAGGRSIVIYAEDEFQRVRMVDSPEVGGCGLDGMWNDDFHHAARVAATGQAEYYYSNYAGTPQELISALKWGFLYQGQWHERQQKFRGSPTWNQHAARFVTFLQNHDQVAHSARGLPLHQLTSPGRLRALTALLLLSPGTPLLFQGQEFAAATPFLFFADHEPDLGRKIREGRWEFLRNFDRVAGLSGPLPETDPTSRRTFERCKLDWSECDSHAAALALHRDLIHLRKTDPAFASQNAAAIHGAVLGPEAFALRWMGNDSGDRLLLVNLGRDLEFRPPAEPLLALPAGAAWRILFSSEDPRYGGAGTPIFDIKNWRIPGHAAIVLIAE